MKENRKRRNKKDAFVLIVGLCILGLLEACISLAAQYYKLTNALEKQSRYAWMVQEAVLTECGLPEEVESETETDEQQTEIKEAVTEQQTEIKEAVTEQQTEVCALAVIQETELETERISILEETEFLEESEVFMEPVENQAEQITIADIPNSLYEKFYDPENLRSTLYAFLLDNGFETVRYCTCEYEYEEGEDVLSFVLRAENGLRIKCFYSQRQDSFSYLFL